ncbi:Voltage-gated hydrogen channel 1 [Quillaja saponaria]|uniref:Voltage-gated hydrogen channel 1 n=1 Tax=Quillaja saponaria TaxID=32244 RepID=A0AAD7VKD9_QUISA|nr:Voltage-gated hydrogen channel 1 [Quillaja saponaria]
MNNNSVSTHCSSQIHQTQPATNLFSIEIIESSVQNLIKSFHRRQTWFQFFFNVPSIQQDLISRAPWRTYLATFLESTWVRALAISLLIIDLIITILELSSSLVFSCKPNSTRSIEEVWYHWIGIAILSLLSAKTVALAVALGPSVFFRRPGYVIDGAILIGALFLEAFLERKGGGLLVVVSLWRVVRVVESAFELSDEAIEAQIEGIVCEFEALKEENKRLGEIIAMKDQVIAKLNEELDQHQQN